MARTEFPPEVAATAARAPLPPEASPGHHPPARTGQGIGARVPRKEDRKHLLGKACFLGDIKMAGLQEVAFLRSPLAHAHLRGVRFAPEFKGRIFTAADFGDGVKPMRTPNNTPSYRMSSYPALARGKVRMVGEPIAMCVAPTRAEAEDLFAEVTLDLDELPALVDAVAARLDQANLVHEEFGDNVFMTTETDIDFEKYASQAEVVVKREFRFARHCAAPMEGKGVLAYWDWGADQLVVYSSTQVPHMIRTGLSEILGLPQGQIRVIAPDVGGGFGYKSVLMPEEIALAWLAYTQRKPVRWTEDRREHLTGGANTREHHYVVTAHADARGKLLALDVELTCNIGAYSVWPCSAGLEATLARMFIPGPWHLRGFRCKTYSVATNKPPQAPYRGVARPGAAISVELTLEAVARAIGRDPVQVKLENLVPAAMMPYDAVTGSQYDSGDYPQALRTAMQAIRLSEVRARQARGEPDGRLIGVGFCSYIETTAPSMVPYVRSGVPNMPGHEQATLRMTPDGGLEIRVGIQSHGQGLETSLAQVAHEILGIDIDAMRVVHGDTATTPFSTGIYASRGMVMAGGGVSRAAKTLAERIKAIAAHLLHCTPAQVELGGGLAHGPGGSIPLRQVAHAWYITPDRLPGGVDPQGLEATVGYMHQAIGGPVSYGTHAVVVAVDPELGGVEILDYAIVEDCGTVVNPIIVEGQTYGGTAQGIGTALFEEMAYDASGQPLASTFADYLLPGAPEVPMLSMLHTETPSQYTEHGIKGMGEGGAIGGAGSVCSAINDALAAIGAEVTDTPMTPRRILTAIMAAQARKAQA